MKTQLWKTNLIGIGGLESLALRPQFVAEKSFCMVGLTATFIIERDASKNVPCPLSLSCLFTIA